MDVQVPLGARREGSLFWRWKGSDALGESHKLSHHISYTFSMLFSPTSLCSSGPRTNFKCFIFSLGHAQSSVGAQLILVYFQGPHLMSHFSLS